MFSVWNKDQGQKWNDIVKSFPDYDVYYLPQYTRAFEVIGDGEAQLLYFEGCGLRAANVVMLRDIALDERFAGKIDLNTYFDFVTPYGYGGWIFDGEINKKSINSLNENYMEYCIANGIVSEFVRFHPQMGSEEVCASMYEIVTHAPVVILDLRDPETIWNNLSGFKRNRIRKAIKNDVAILKGLDQSLLRQFREIYDETMSRNQARSYYFFNQGFYDSVLADLKDNALIFYAVKDETVLAMDIMIMAGKRMNYHLGGSRLEYRSLEPSSLLMYSAALWGYEHGYESLMIGGGLGSEEDSLLRFKQGFNRRSNFVFKTGRKIFDKDRYQELCVLRKQNGNHNANSTFFPCYRS